MLYALDSRAWSSSSEPEAVGMASDQFGQAMADRPGTTNARISANSRHVNHRFIIVSLSGLIVTNHQGPG